MTIIQAKDIVDTVAGALQYISYYHPADYIAHLARAYEREQSPAAKDAIAQILTNSRMSAEGHRPICQDTGIVNVFLKIGMDVSFEGCAEFGDGALDDVINEGVRRAYNHPDNTLRASVVNDPQFDRKNTKDNTPAVIFTELVPGNKVDITVAAKGGGSENKSKMYMLNPGDNVVDWVLKTVPTMGAGWCPPGMLGIGIGGTAEKAVLMAKESLMEDIDMYELQAKQASGAALSKTEALRLELHEKVNALGIGAQGLGGLTTVLDVKIKMYPTHAASKPIAMIPNCAATRHAHVVMDGSGPVYLDPPSLDLWPNVNWMPDTQKSKRVDLNTLTKEEVANWKPGQTLLLNGKMLTGRDAAHKRIQTMLAAGEKLPVDFTNRVIYYVGPVDPVKGEAVGPAGPTTATRMDGFTEMMLAQTGLISMVGKAERGPVAIEAIKKHKSAYLMAVGGAAYLVSKAIRTSKVVGFADLGMEAIYEFDVVDMPVTVAVDSGGTSAHITGPAEWQTRIATGEFKGIGVKVADWQTRTMLAIKLENSTASVSADAERILRSLPRWFGIESSLLEYVNDTVSLPTFTATEDSKIIAFLSLKKHASHAWEVSCLAVQADRRHLGIGRLLHEHVESCLIEQGARFLQVKTVGEAHPSSEYAQTRAFYKALGYCELETFAELWGAGLPVLQFLKALAHKS